MGTSQPLATSAALKILEAGRNPFDAAADLLPESVIYSHGLCEPCVIDLGFGDTIN